MFTPEALRQIIRISLLLITYTKYPLWTAEAEEMLLMIAAHESGLGRNLSQIGGPALGIYQMEPDTLVDNYKNYLFKRRIFLKQVQDITGTVNIDEKHLQYNPIYSTIHARIKLYRSPGKLPEANNIVDMAAYCKKYYNSLKGKATPKKYIDAYNRLIKQ